MTETATAHRIAITRVFDAPRELVWAAWTDPDQLVCWWGKRGWTAQRSSLVLDVRPGAAFRIVSVCDADGTEMTNEGVWREVVEPERLVFARSPDGDEEELTVVTFTDLGGGRTELRFDAVVRMPGDRRDRAAAGVASALDRLADLLEGSR
jgi:uncharacterized protein YndB with AHSA1/START domain